jgi:transcriptional regulator with XRE-family HTH domain
MPYTNGAKIRERREKLRMSTEQAAAAVRNMSTPERPVSLTSAALRNVELGHRPASEAVCRALAKVLRMNYRNVIGGVPAEPKFIRY